MTAELKFMPSSVESPEKLLSLARALEQEAARRYLGLAERMRLRHERRLAALFEFLASIEEKHVEKLARRAAQERDAAFSTGVTSWEVPARLTSWEVPEDFDAEAADSSLLTPYRALAIAVRNEARAFAFYSYIASSAPNDSVRKIAEELAQEELAHADLLRRERRKAYRAAKIRARPAPLQVPQTVTELWALCLETESRAARYHRALADVLTRRGDHAAAFIAAAQDEEDCAREAADRIGRSIPEGIERMRLTPTIRVGRRLLEESFERYSDIADRSKEEDVLQLAMRLAARAVRRLSRVNLALASSPVEAEAHGSP